MPYLRIPGKNQINLGRNSKPLEEILKAEFPDVTEFELGRCLAWNIQYNIRIKDTDDIIAETVYNPDSNWMNTWDKNGNKLNPDQKNIK